MPRPRKARQSGGMDFESEFFDLLRATIEGIDEKVDRISKDQEVLKKLEPVTEDLVNQVERLNKVVFPEQVTKPSQLPPWWRDPNIIKLLTIIALCFLGTILLAAGLKGIKISLPGL